MVLNLSYIDMKKNSMKITVKQTRQRNWVAKYGRRLNRAAVFRDRTQYQRRAKHRLRDRDGL
jgi:hypothetical protein